MTVILQITTRISICGYIVFFCGVPIVWKSKSMKSVVLSTTEAMYVAVSEVVKEIRLLDTIPTRNGRELGEIWVSKVGTNF